MFFWQHKIAVSFCETGLFRLFYQINKKCMTYKKLIFSKLSPLFYRILYFVKWR